MNWQGMPQHVSSVNSFVLDAPARSAQTMAETNQIDRVGSLGVLFCTGDTELFGRSPLQIDYNTPFELSLCYPYDISMDVLCNLFIQCFA